MQLPIQVDDGLADAAVDDGHAASVGAGDGRVGRGQFRCVRVEKEEEEEEEEEKEKTRVNKNKSTNYSQSVSFVMSQRVPIPESGAGSAGGCKQRVKYPAFGITSLKYEVVFSSAKPPQVSGVNAIK